MTTASHLRDVSAYTPAPAVAAGVHLLDVIPLPATLQVLLVEDDDADAYLIERALSANPRVGAIVRARDGVEALELVDARRMKPDLAIVDLHMPRKDGFALLSELAARVTVEFPSVILTSSKRGADALRSRKRGATLFVTKPDSLEKLTAALNRVVATV